ncbi:hypothetical protein DSECCO2_381090 [anaerobic digester metagenome]
MRWEKTPEQLCSGVFSRCGRVNNDGAREAGLRIFVQKEEIPPYKKMYFTLITR